MTKSETQLTLKELEKKLHKQFGFCDMDDCTARCKNDMRIGMKLIKTYLQQALTSLTGLACDKCRVRMEDFNGKGKP